MSLTRHCQKCRDFGMNTGCPSCGKIGPLRYGSDLSPEFHAPKEPPRLDVMPSMTLREHYAGLAMQGLLANCDPMVCPTVEEIAARLAGASVLYVDALIAELEKTK